MKTIFIIIALFVSTISIAVAIPQAERDSLKESAAQISFIYPIGTQGTNSTDYYNHFSFNLIAGYMGGLQGFEFGGLVNVDQRFVKGFQLAGMGNISIGHLQGAQVAGFLNKVKSAKGFQSAGFMNLNTSSSHATQLAGFLNVIRGDNKGAQLAGFANIAGDVEGFQGSGFINVARHVKGVQLSFINVADSVNGVPVGFLSIVRKNGYRTLEVWGSEALHANVGFKIGVEKFYNIFTLGTQFADADFRWGFGYGFGTLWRPAPTLEINLDLISFTIYEEGNQIFKEQDLNLLNTLRLGISKQFSKHFGLFIAPTFNVMVSQMNHKEAGNIGSDIAPWTVYDKTFSNKTNVKMWPGVQVGIRF